MKLLTLTALALALTSPVTHAETSKTEQMQELNRVRNATLSAARKQDVTLVRLICERRPEERNCTATATRLLEQYKTNVIAVDRLEEAYQATRDKLLGGFEEGEAISSRTSQ